MYGQTQGQQIMSAAFPAANGYAHESQVRTPELPAAMDRVQQAMEGLLYQIDAMDNRLTGVVARPIAPSPDTKNAALKAAMNTGFGSQLDSLNERLQQAHSRLSGLLDRLEF